MNEFSKIQEKETWVEYVLRIGRTEEKTIKINDDTTARVIFHLGTKRMIPFEAIKGELDQMTIDLINKLKDNFQFFRSLSELKRKELLLDLE